MTKKGLLKKSTGALCRKTSSSCVFFLCNSTQVSCFGCFLFGVGSDAKNYGETKKKTSPKARETHRKKTPLARSGEAKRTIFWMMTSIWSNYSDRKHDRFPPNGDVVREITLFQGNLGWWNIIPFGQNIPFFCILQGSWVMPFIFGRNQRCLRRNLFFFLKGFWRASWRIIPQLVSGEWLWWS